MKNKILLVIVFLIGIFFPLTSVDALTKINFEEKANGQINTTLHFEEGFVGAIDITLNINGDVDVKNFKFSNKISSGNYGKEYKYNKEKNCLTIRVTAGGTGTSHNLLNDKKELNLGTINFTSSAKENINYNLSSASFKIVDNNWSSKTINESNINLGDKTQFVYKVTNTNKEESKGDDNTENSDDKDSKDNNTEVSSKDNDSENSQSTANNTKEKSSVKSVKKQTETKKNSSDKETDSSPNAETNKSDNEEAEELIDDENTADETRDENKSAKDELEDDKKSHFSLPILITAISIISVCSGAYLFIIKRK